MWSVANIVAVCTGFTALLGAVAAVIAQLRHNANPGAHDGHASPADPAAAGKLEKTLEPPPAG